MTRLRSLARWRPDPLLLGMLAAVTAAALDPALGARNGPLHLGQVTAVGVGLVFFLHGAGLSLERLKAGAGNWRLHLLVQVFTFALFPLAGALISVSARGLLPRALLDGMFYLCALPSTVATSVALTAIARGNVAAAVFNATLSSLIGMLATPVLVNLWLHAAGSGLSLGQQLLGVARQLLLPFAVGLGAHRFIGGWLARQRTRLGWFDRAVIVLIVYNAFCDATAAGLWRDYGALTLTETLALCAALLVLALTATRLAARRLGLTVVDEIVAVFCGSKKSLAVGIPMARLLFGGNELGFIVLPIMFYHQLQLFVCSLLAQRYARRRREA